MKLSRKVSKNIIRFSSLALYIMLTFVILIESMMNGASSKKQSASVGSAIGHFVNNLFGDQGKEILPEEIVFSDPIYEASVGDSYKLECEIYPVSSTDRSLIYVSSDESVASVDASGNLTFYSEGEVSIKVFCKADEKVFNEILIDVLPVEAKSVTATIDASKDDDGNYLLRLGSQYEITSVIVPSNATYKNVTYSCLYDDISIDEEGNINTLSYNSDAVHYISVSLGELAPVTLPYKVFTEVSKVALEDIEAVFCDEIYIGQSYVPSVNFIPASSSYTSYHLETDNSAVISVSSHSMCGVKEGSALIRIVSDDYPDIYKEKEITVLPLNEVSTYDIKNNYSVNVDSYIKITPYNISPSYSDTSSLTYEIDDTSVACSEGGRIKGLKEGTTEITLNINGVTRKTTLTVNAKPVAEEDITLTLKKGEIYLLKDHEYNLNDYIYVKNFASFSSVTEGFYEGTFDSFKTLKTGSYYLTMTDTNNKSKDVEVHIIPDFEILFTKDSLQIGEEGKIILEGEDMDFNVTSSSSLIISRLDDKTYVYKGRYQDESSLCVVPIYEGKEISSFKINKTIQVNDIYTKELRLSFYDNSNQLLDNSSLEVIEGSRIKFYVSLSVDTTRSYMEYHFENEKGENTDKMVLSSSGNILCKEIGDYYFVCTETYSSLTYRQLIRVRNVTGFQEDDPVSFSLNDYTRKGNTYTLINGLAYQMNINYVQGATYRICDYNVEDESVLTIGKDGAVALKKTGSTKVLLRIDDGEEITQKEITIVVSKKTMIMNMDNFAYKVRKALGHFGVFLVLGIFASLSFMLLFDKNWGRRISGVIITACSGFAVAVVSEWIQLHVDGRCGCWADVWIDYSGYSVAVSLFIFGFIIFWLVNDRRNKIRNYAGNIDFGINEEN